MCAHKVNSDFREISQIGQHKRKLVEGKILSAGYMEFHCSDAGKNFLRGGMMCSSCTLSSLLAAWLHLAASKEASWVNEKMLSLPV